MGVRMHWVGNKLVRYLSSSLLLLGVSLFSVSGAAFGRYPAVPYGYAGHPGAVPAYVVHAPAAAYPGYPAARWPVPPPPGRFYSFASRSGQPGAGPSAAAERHRQPGTTTAITPVIAGSVAPQRSSQSMTLAGEVLPARLADPELPVSDRKQLFIETLLPVIEMENLRVLKQRERALQLLQQASLGRQPEADAIQWLQQLAKSYRVEGDPLADAAAAAALQARVDAVPTGLALAQAANESGWGSSRFAQEANNLFGIWTYDPKQGIKPKQRASGKSHLVRVFDSLRQSVRIYLHTLNSHPAYKPLRSRRAQLRKDRLPLEAAVLADGLVKYSELGQDYVTIIKSVIRDNELERFDYTRIAAAG
jgi:Bax protein